MPTPRMERSLKPQQRIAELERKLEAFDALAKALGYASEYIETGRLPMLPGGDHSRRHLQQIIQAALALAKEA